MAETIQTIAIRDVREEDGREAESPWGEDASRQTAADVQSPGERGHLDRQVTRNLPEGREEAVDPAEAHLRVERGRRRHEWHRRRQEHRIG